MSTYARIMGRRNAKGIEAINQDIDIIKSAIRAGSYEAMSYITIVANAPETGKKFAYWQDQHDSVLSYSPQYGFYCVRDLNPVAVYVPEDETVTQVAHSTVTVVSPLDDVIVFIIERCVPLANTIVTHGFLVTNNPTTGSDESAFIIGGTDVVKGESSTKALVGVVKLNQTAVAGETWYARGFVTHKDSADNTTTVYSDIVSGVIPE